MRSLDITKENLDNQRNAVQEERRLGVDNQPYGKTFEVARRARLRQLRLRALGDRLDGRSRRRDRRRRRVVLQDLLRAQQRRRSRSSATSTPKATLEKVRKYFESIPVAAGAAAGRHDRAGADRGAAHDASRTRWRGCRASTWSTRSRRARRPTTTRCGAGDGPLERPQLAVLRERSSGRSSCAPSVSGVRGESRGPGLFSVVGIVAPGQDARGSRSGDRRGDRAGEDRPDRGLGNREGAQQRAQRSFVEQPRQLAAAARCSSAQDALFYDDPDRINTRADAIAKVTAADVQRVAKQYLVKTGPHGRDHDAEGRAPAKGGL